MQHAENIEKNDDGNGDSNEPEQQWTHVKLLCSVLFNVDSSQKFQRSRLARLVASVPAWWEARRPPFPSALRQARVIHEN